MVLQNSWTDEDKRNEEEKYGNARFTKISDKDGRMIQIKLH